MVLGGAAHKWHHVLLSCSASVTSWLPEDGQVCPGHLTARVQSNQRLNPGPQSRGSHQEMGLQVALTKISVQLTQREPVSQEQLDASLCQEPGRKLDELPSCCWMCVCKRVSWGWAGGGTIRAVEL